jgi:DNA primase
MQSRGASFMEAVEQLAFQAGLEVPKPAPATPRPTGAVTGFQEKPAAGRAAPVFAEGFQELIDRLERPPAG